MSTPASRFFRKLNFRSALMVGSSLSFLLFSQSLVSAVSLRTEAVFDRLDRLGERVIDLNRNQPLDLAEAFPGDSRKLASKAMAAPVSGNWKRNITSTVFWVGESASKNNPVHNRSSSWDVSWASSFGGTDSPDPAKRNGWFPSEFVPKQTTFYVALPYNDMTRKGHRPEAKSVIPWFWQKYRGPGVSVCHGQWVALHKNGKVCYARWMDVGPFTVDDWQYVFGANTKPLGNRNGDAGIDVSPAIRDFLGLSGMDAVDWSFVGDGQVPRGPWWHGSNYKF